MPDELLGPYLKIERANHHIAELESLFDSFLGGGDTHAIVEHDYGGAKGFSPQLNIPLPAHVATILGDALHNLRAALDHLYIVLTRRNGQAPTKHTKFPIGPQRYVLSQLTTANPNPSEAVMEFIRDNIRPYDGPDGDGLLTALHELDISDKHIVLIPTVGQVRISKMIIRNTDGSTGITITDSVIGKTRSPIENMIGPIGMIVSGMGEIEQKEVPKLTIVFGEDQPLSGEAIIPTLHDISVRVTEVIKDLSAVQ